MSIPVVICMSAGGVVFPFEVRADWLDDSSGSLEFRNFYMNRDFRQSSAQQSKADEWAQGFIFKIESGFTPGVVGLGLDAIGMLGVKLDSSRARRGTGLLPFDHDGEPVDDYSELGLSAKLKLSKTVLKAGTLMLQLPVASYNDVRLLPSTFTGTSVSSQEIDGLTFNAARLEKQNYRDSSSNDEMSYGGVNSSHLDLAGGSYALTESLSASYYYAEMKDIYRQNYFGFVHNYQPTSALSIKTDLRLFETTGAGSKKLRGPTRVDGGAIDNRFLNGMVAVGFKAHRLSLGFQTLSGEGDFAYPGLDPYSVNLGTIDVFTRANTDLWQVRYDYNFVAQGIPGLTFMTRYFDVKHIETASVKGGTQWERDSDLIYTVQSGTLKGLNIRLRNASLRSGNGLSTAIDENRIIIGYSVALW
ncbi:outer membrane porin, OprD family [Pseudomonas hunanensis]|uniref:Outer membrane porin, OprD family n=1 Tax=Pseudomonas hunanensis TaxID=1247546 RepID=A0ABD6MX23_9PSED|nr:OprD family porin [Pseudomonas hunanensis]NWL45118.1 outer membrane porin, OprD family [Pseudomonas hunanensis]